MAEKVAEALEKLKSELRVEIRKRLSTELTQDGLRIRLNEARREFEARGWIKPKEK